MKKDLFDSDICIVVQGPLTYENDLYNTYINYKNNVIFSSNNESKFLSENFITLKNELAPFSGRANFNNQIKNTFIGVNKAKELNFNYVLKIRSDIFINDVVSFIDGINKRNNYFSAYHLHDGGYLCEHMVFGSTDFMSKLWDIPLSDSSLPPETQLTKRYEDICDLKKLDFLFPILYNNNIVAYWKKYDKLLNDYKNDKLFIYEKPQK